MIRRYLPGFTDELDHVAGSVYIDQGNGPLNNILAVSWRKNHALIS